MAMLQKQLPPVVVHHNSASLRTAAEEARRILLRRGLVVQQGGLLVVVPAKQDLLQYYANSLAHLIPEGPLGLPEGGDAARAFDISATARS